MAEDILTTRPGTYQQDVLQTFLSLSIMVKWITDANNASNVISEVKRTPLAAMTHLLISNKGALRRPMTNIYHSYDDHPIQSHLPVTERLKSKNIKRLRRLPGKF